MTNTACRETLSTLLSGEDQTHSVFRVEGQFTPSGFVATNTLVKSTEGFVHCFLAVQSATPTTTGSVSLINGTSSTGTVIVSLPVLSTTTFAPFTFCPDVVMSTGIYLAISTVTQINAMVSFR